MCLSIHLSPLCLSLSNSTPFLAHMSTPRVVILALLVFSFVVFGIGLSYRLDGQEQGTAAGAARRLSAGTCQDSSARTFTVSTFPQLKNAVACANGNTNDRYKIFVNQDVQATGRGGQYSAIVVEANAKLEITGTKAGSNVTAIRGQGQSGGYRLFRVYSGANVILSNLDLRDGYAVSLDC